MSLKKFIKRLKKQLGGGRGLFGALFLIALPFLFPAAGGLMGWLGGKSLLYRAILGSSLFGKRKKPTYGGHSSRSYAFGGAADNLAQAGSTLPVVFGEVRVTGLRVWQQVEGETLRDFVVMSEGPVAEVDDVWVNGLPIQGIEGSSYTALLGTSAQAKPGSMSLYRPGVPFLTGVASTIKANDDTGGNPVVSARVKGVSVKQWNGSAWVTDWSDNPAWIIRHLLVQGGHEEAALDDDSFISFADYCATVISGEYELGMANVAPAATVTGGNSPASANDRKRPTKPDAAGTWWIYGPATGVSVLGEMDFGVQRRVGRVVIHWWGGDDRTYNHLLLEYWDGAAWQLLVDRTDKDYQFRGRTVLEAPNALTQKLRVSVGKSSKGTAHGTHIAEMEVFASTPARRYTANVVLDHERPLRDWMEDILSACNAWLTLTDSALLGVDWERAKTAVFGFTEENILQDSFEFREVSPGDRPNRVRLGYFDRVLNERRQVQADHAADQDATSLRVKELEFLHVTHPGHAGRLARMLINIASQVRFATSFEAKPGATLPVLPGDVVTVTHRVAGWINKPFWVDSVTPGFYDGAVFELVEYRPEVYGGGLGGWTLSELGSSLQNPLAAPPHPTGLLLSESQRQMKDGAWLPSIIVSFTPPASGGVSHIDVELSGDGGATFKTVGSTSLSPFEITGLANGTYRVRLISVNSLGVKASPLTAPFADLTIAGKVSAASGVTGFTGSFDNEIVRLVWNAVADSAARHYRVKKATGAGQAWAAATLFAEVDTTELSFEATPAIGRGFIFFQVKAVDRSGNESSGTQGATVALANSFPVMNTTTPVIEQAPPNAHRVSWASVTTDPDLARYEVHRSLASGFTPSKATLAGEVAQGNATGSFTLTLVIPHEPAATPGSTYYYRIVGIDRVGDKIGDQYSNAIAFSQQAGLAVEAPLHPTGLILTEVVTLNKDGASMSNVDVGWTNPGGERFSHVAVELAEDVASSPGTYKRVGTAASAPFRIQALRVATWWVRLIAIDLMGNEASPGGAPVSSIVLDGITDAAATITGFAADYTSDVIRLSWNKATEKDVSHYILKRTTNPGDAWTSGTVVRDHVLGTAVLVPALELATRGPVYFQIKAVNRSGNESSGAQGAATSAANAAPVFTGVTPEVIQNPPNSHLIRFNALVAENDLDRYEVHRSPANGFTPTKDTLVSAVKAGKIASGATAPKLEAVVSFNPGDSEGTVYYYRVQALDTVSDVVGDQYGATSRSQQASAVLAYIQGAQFTPHLLGSVNRRSFRRPAGVIALNGYVYVANIEALKIYRYHPGNGELTVWLTGEAVDSFAWDGAYMYTYNAAGGLLKRWSTWDTTPTQDVSGDPWTAGGKVVGPNHVGIAYRDTQSGNPRLFVVGLSTGLHGAYANAREVYLYTIAPTVTAVTEISATTMDTLMGGFYPAGDLTNMKITGVDFHPATSRLWLSMNSYPHVHRLVLSGSWSLEKTYPAALPSAGDMKTVYDGNTPRYIYQTNYNDNTLAAVAL